MLFRILVGHIHAVESRYHSVLRHTHTNSIRTVVVLDEDFVVAFECHFSYVSLSDEFFVAQSVITSVVDMPESKIPQCLRACLTRSCHSESSITMFSIYQYRQSAVIRKVVVILL